MPSSHTPHTSFLYQSRHHTHRPWCLETGLGWFPPGLLVSQVLCTDGPRPPRLFYAEQECDTKKNNTRADQKPPKLRLASRNKACRCGKQERQRERRARVRERGSCCCGPGHTHVEEGRPACAGREGCPCDKGFGGKRRKSTSKQGHHRQQQRIAVVVLLY